MTTSPNRPSRRQLLSAYPLGAVALYALPASRLPETAPSLQHPGGTAEESAKDESFWRQVRSEFDLDSNRITTNLAAGAYNAPPRTVHAAFLRATEFINAMPGVNRSLAFGDGPREKLRTRLANTLGVSADELAFTRGTTEALNIVSAGVQLESGDEVLTTDLDYRSLRAAWRLRGLRDGVRLREVSVPAPPSSPTELVQILADAFTPRTRLVHICHITGPNGQIFPVRDVCDMAHDRGAQVVVDGALAYGVLPVDLSELGCDYYGTSLHKGIYAPSGTGLLYVRKGLVSDLLPLFGAHAPRSDDVRKFEEIGTSPVAPLASVNAALDFHERIGTDRVQARLHFLKRTWMEILGDSPHVTFHTSPAPEQSCAIVNARIGDADPYSVWRYLYDQHGISCYYSTEPFQGVIVRFHIHTLRNDVERCAHILRRIAKEGLPGK